MAFVKVLTSNCIVIHMFSFIFIAQDAAGAVYQKQEILIPWMIEDS